MNYFSHLLSVGKKQTENCFSSNIFCQSCQCGCFSVWPGGHCGPYGSRKILPDTCLVPSGGASQGRLLDRRCFHLQPWPSRSALSPHHSASRPRHLCRKSAYEPWPLRTLHWCRSVGGIETRTSQWLCVSVERRTGPWVWWRRRKLEVSVVSLVLSINNNIGILYQQ